MKQKLIIGILITALVCTNLVAFGIQDRNDKLEKQNATITKQIDQLQKEVKNVKDQNAVLQKEGQKLYDDNEKLKQEIENLKALKEAAEKEVAVSRGLSSVVYGEYSRVDVPSGITVKLLDKAFVGTAMEGLGYAFVAAEQETGINAIFLASIGALESGWGTSDFALYRNNLFGFGSHDDLEEEYTVYFNSHQEGVVEVAKFLKTNYLDSSGMFYNGATPYGINVKYSSSSEWSTKVVDIMNIIVDRVTS